MITSLTGEGGADENVKKQPDKENNGRKLDFTSSPLPPPFLAVVTALQNFTQKNQISKIERRKGNGNYKIFDIEREISFSTLNFSHLSFEKLFVRTRKVFIVKSW